MKSEALLTTDDFDYKLPKELIAQFPLKQREQAKMMVLNRRDKTISHKHFSDICDYLKKDDVLVLNNTKVIPARLLGKKETGANIEIFLLNPAVLNNPKKTFWYTLIKPLKRLKENDIVKIHDDLSVKLVKKNARDKNETQTDRACENLVELIFSGENVFDILYKYGKIPLPPYINRDADETDKNTYQTVFAQKEGSVAAPTAGLHFTNNILEKIKQKGVKITYVTLNVGLGTFLPVKSQNIEEHKMHYESFEIPCEAAQTINSAKGSIISVGTTVTRTLEAVAKKYGKLIPVCDDTNIFIYPPYEFQVVDKLLTNFHLPKSTLIMLVSALAGREFTLSAYKKAVENNYRFFSYGDCMLIDA